MDRGAWRATVQRITKSCSRLSTHTELSTSGATHLCMKVQGLFRAEAACWPKILTDDSFRWMWGIWENAKRNKSRGNLPKYTGVVGLEERGCQRVNKYFCLEPSGV